MTKLISFLFGLTLCVALIPAYAATTETKWIFVAIAFIDNEAVDSKIIGFPTKEVCEKSKVQLTAAVKEAGGQLWSECVLMTREIVQPKNPTKRES